MNKILNIFLVAALLFIVACGKEKTPVVESSEPPIPECLQQGLSDIVLPLDGTKLSWKDGGACGLKDDIEWKSYIMSSFSSKKTNDKADLSLYNFYFPKVLFKETSVIRNIPLKKGIFPITKKNFDGKDADLICSTSGFFYVDDDVTRETFRLDVRKKNTLEVLSWDERTNEVYGVYTAHYLQEAYVGSGFEDSGTSIAIKNCYFKAIVK